MALVGAKLLLEPTEIQPTIKIDGVPCVPEVPGNIVPSDLRHLVDQAYGQTIRD